MDVPEGSLLAVKNLPLGFILFPVDPANDISQCEKPAAALLISAFDVAVESGWKDQDRETRDPKMKNVYGIHLKNIEVHVL